MEPGGSMPHSQRLSNNPYPEPNCNENYGFQVVPVHPGCVSSDNGVHELGITIYSDHHALGVRVRPGNQIVPSFYLQ